MAEYKLSYTASEIDEALGRKPIVDVRALPETDIKEDCIYRLSTPIVLYGGVQVGKVYEVNGLPTTGELIMSENDVMVVYYNLQDQVTYGYLDSEFAGYFELTAGWYTLEQIAELAEYPYGGVVNDESQITDETLFYVVLNTYTFYVYKNKWYDVPIGTAGVGWSTTGTEYTNVPLFNYDTEEIELQTVTASIGAEAFNWNGTETYYTQDENGDYTVENILPPNTAVGEYSHAEGKGTIASGAESHSEGYMTKALAYCAHAEGNQTVVTDINSHAEGLSTTASGGQCHAEGYSTIASGNCSHSEGNTTTASGKYAHSEGCKTESSGESSHSEGYLTVANNLTAHAEGHTTEASGNTSHAEGYKTKATATTAHSEGQLTEAGGNASHAEGYLTKTTGDGSHAEGRETIASNHYAHAEGAKTEASGNSAHAEGQETVASGDRGHAEGYLTTSSGANSHAEGYLTAAKGANSHAEGTGTIASSGGQHVEGMYNISDVDTPNNYGTYAHIVGNGANADTLSNAYTLDWDGNAWYAGDVYVGSTSGTNKDDGSKKLATEEFVTNAVANAGSGSGTSITVDSELSETSENPVQNKVVYETFYNLNDSLTTKFSSIDEEFETMQNEIDILSAGGGTGGSGSGKTLIGEIILNNTNITKGSLSYTLSEELSTQMSNIINQFVDNNKTPITDITYGEITLHSSNGSTIDYEDMLLLAVSFGTFGAMEFLGNEMYVDSMIETIIEQLVADETNTMNIRFYEQNGSNAIIDVGSLPTENINEDNFYRLVTGTFVYNQYLQTQWTCYCVDSLPEVGEAAFTGDLSDASSIIVTAYHNTIDNITSVYLTEDLATQFGMSTGWCPIADVMALTGYAFNGVIYDISEDPKDSTFRLLLKYEMHSYKNKWTTVGAGAMPEVTSNDNGKILMVVDGQWAATTIENGDEVAY